MAALNNTLKAMTAGILSAAAGTSLSDKWDESQWRSEIRIAHHLESATILPYLLLVSQFRVKMSTEKIKNS
jgi:hypothetical protein